LQDSGKGSGSNGRNDLPTGISVPPFLKRARASVAFKRRISPGSFMWLRKVVLVYYAKSIGEREEKMEIREMKLKVIIHEAEEGGLWAEVPAIPGCMTQGESIKELIENLYDAVEGCLSIDMAQIPLAKSDTVMEIAV
jgi:predicted RNase H-like HicB family nuclease